MGCRTLIWLAIAALVVMLVLSQAAFGQVPDPVKTPGAVRDLSRQQICSTKWQARKIVTAYSKRQVTKAMKRRVFVAYGIECAPITKPRGQPRCTAWEIDHLVPRSLGGADDVRNLFPQPYAGRWGARVKDVLEHKLQREVCAGRIGLAEAQREIAADWIALYRRYYGDPR